jgi:SRSO17 transposase
MEPDPCSLAGMHDLMGTDAQRRLGEYFSAIGDVLANKTRRASFATYAMGLLADGERKSMEPIAARACADPDATDAHHQRIQHFLTDSPWSDREVRRTAASYALSAMTRREPVEAWIIDDTGFLKQGKHSVGVQRQYTGSAGKIANCQIGVSLSIATRTEHLPIDFELYLPKGWTDTPALRDEARIPDDIVFKTKLELALDMIRRAVEDGVAPGVVLADSFYGDSAEFRDALRWMGLDYAVGIDATAKVWRLDKLLRCRGEALTVGDIARAVGPSGFRRVTWREGTRATLSARFAAERVVVRHNDGWSPSEREDVWLLMEWRDGEAAPTKFHLATLPRDCTRKQLVHLIKQRWRTERVYEDLKGELGLDHFEGRRFAGWHHHVSVALSCYAFIIAERVRRFPPTTRRQVRADSFPLSA